MELDNTAINENNKNAKEKVPSRSSTKIKAKSCPHSLQPLAAPFVELTPLSYKVKVK